MTTKKQPAALTVTTAQLAELFNVTTRRVQQLAKEGAIPESVSPGRFVLGPSVKGYVAWLQERVTHRDASTFTRDLREQQLREKKRENDRAEGLTISFVEIQDVFDTAASHLVRMLDSLRGRIVPQLEPYLNEHATLDSVGGIIDDEQRRIRGEYADHFETVADTAKSRAEPAPEKEKVRGRMGGRRKKTSAG